MCEGALMEQYNVAAVIMYEQYRSAVVDLVVLWQGAQVTAGQNQVPKKIGISGLNRDLRANQD